MLGTPSSVGFWLLGTTKIMKKMITNMYRDEAMAGDNNDYEYEDE